jgi:hypothetical protein
MKVNSTNREEVDKIIDGTVFIRKCSKCGEEIIINFPVVYINEQSATSIMFLPIGVNCNKDIDVPDGARITHHMLSFIEKVRIAEMEMDDQIVELVKIIAYHQVAQMGKTPSDGLEGIECWIKDDKSIDLDFRCSNRHFLLEVPYQMYQDVKREFGNKLKSYSDPKIVDLNWAIMFLNSITIEENQSNQKIDDDWDEIVFEE